MSNQPTIRTSEDLASAFKWKTSKDEYISPVEMETRHLFFTIRMIWNHTMPEMYRSKHYRHYRLGSFYTQEYLLSAIHALLGELSLRKDIHPSWQVDIDSMRHFAAKLKHQQLA